MTELDPQEKERIHLALEAKSDWEKAEYMKYIRHNTIQKQTEILKELALIKSNKDQAQKKENEKKESAENAKRYHNPNYEISEELEETNEKTRIVKQPLVVPNENEYENMPSDNPGIDRLPHSLQELTLNYYSGDSSNNEYQHPTYISFFAKSSLQHDVELIKKQGANHLAISGVISDNLTLLIRNKPELIDLPLQVVDQHKRIIRGSIIQIAAMIGNINAIIELAHAAALNESKIVERLFPVLCSETALAATRRRRDAMFEAAKTFTQNYIIQTVPHNEYQSAKETFRKKLINNDEIITCGYVADTKVLLDIVTKFYECTGQYCKKCIGCTSIQSVSTCNHKKDTRPFRDSFWYDVYVSLVWAGSAYEALMFFPNIGKIQSMNCSREYFYSPWEGNVNDTWHFIPEPHHAKHLCVLDPKLSLWGLNINTFTKYLEDYLDYKERYAKKLSYRKKQTHQSCFKRWSTRLIKTQ